MFTMIDLAQDHRNQLLEEARQHRLAQIARDTRRRRRWALRTAATTETGPRRGSPVGIALLGLTITALSAAALMVTLHSDDATTKGVIPPAPRLMAAVSTADLIYEPGHSSGWHVHPGVHSVVVLSGTLTVYDEACEGHDYGPGQAYVGGREPHVALNTGAEAAGLVITYVADPSADTAGSVVPAPTGCVAA